MKKIMISTVAAFAFLAIAGTVSAVNATEIYSSSTGFLKVGSGMGAKAYQNVNVKAAQTALNTCVPGSNLVVDGKFGPLTTGVFKAFQASKGIKVDGIIGSDTAAKLAACSGSMVIDNGSTVMSGTEGYLSNDVKLGAYNSTKVMEGDRDKVVFGFEVLAKDADQKIDGLSIALTNSNGASSKKITRYASEISVWLDGKEIGRKSVSNYSSDSSDVYTYRFTGMTGVIKKDMKGQVVIAVSGTTTMDSTDATNEAWAINVGTAVSGSTNYVSAVSPNGRYRDYGSAALASSTIDFQKAGGVSSDQKFKVTTASTNPVAQSVQVSNTSDTTDKLLLAFDAKAENAGMIVQKIPAIVTTTIGLADGVAPNPEAIVKTLKLYANGTLLATESIPSGVSTQTVTFGNISKLNYAIAANATAKFEIRADLNDIESTGIVSTDFDNGDKVAVSVNSGTMTVELDNVNKDTVSNVTGSSTGENQDLRAEGMLVTMGAMSSSATSNNDGEIINRTISIPVTIKALDSTVYVDNAIQNAATVSGTNALSFVFEDNTGAADTIVNSATLTSSNAPVEGNGYRIDSGTERSFMVTIIANGVPTEAQKQYRVQLTQGQSWTNAALTVGSAVQDLAPVNAYESPYFSLNLN